MKLADLIRKNSKVEVATAIPAIPATHGTENGGNVARIATIAVASPTSEKLLHPSWPELQRLIQKVGAFYGFSPDEFKEAQEAAKRDPENALKSYRATYFHLRAAGDLQ